MGKCVCIFGKVTHFLVTYTYNILILLKIKNIYIIQRGYPLKSVNNNAVNVIRIEK